MTSTEIIPTDWVSNQNIIKVIGIGGGGSNAVTHMYRTGIANVDFLICNTDAQSLALSPVPEKLQLGKMITKGRGAGCNPEIARQAALESEEKIHSLLDGSTEMVFITAGMGGGTGTGAAPVVARIAKEMGLLTVAVVTLPFRDEGQDFLRRALDGIHELEQEVDSLLIIDNEKLYNVFGDLSIFEAFPHVDDVLSTAVKGIAEIITYPGFINVDFADVKMVMQQSGMALMGSGSASGENRAIKAVEQAFSSPLLDDVDLSNASNVLINISSSKDNGLTMSELSQIMDYIKEYTGDVSNFKRGVVCNPDLKDQISITVVATGFSLHTLPQIIAESKRRTDTVTLSDEADGASDKDRLEGEILETPPVEDNTFKVGDPHIFLASPVLSRREASAARGLRQGRKKNKPALILDPGENINELEEVPAYIRRRNMIPATDAPTESMPLKIEDTAEGQGLCTDNAYIHQSQD